MLVTAEMVGNSFAFVGQRLKCNSIDDVIDEICGNGWKISR